MDTKGRKLLKYAAGFLAAAALMSAAYTTTAMASSIGLIDTKDLLDIHAEADDSSEVVGQVMDEGHVAILNRSGGWVQIKAGDIVGWVPDANLTETEVSNEEAVEANQEVIEQLEEEAEEISEETEQETEASQTETPENETEEESTEGESKEEEPKEEDTKEGTVPEQEQINAETAAQDALAEQEKAAEAAELAAAEAARAAKEQEELLIRAEAQKQAILTAAGASEEDLYLLASIIYCEAGSEPYVGKVAVGSVVMNRVKSDIQPDTISEVIYAKGQFSPVRNGSLKRAMANNSADASCYQAAMEALTGQKPVGDKLYFRRVNGRSGQVIGRHVFY